MAPFALRHISSICVGRDIPSIQKWLVNTAKSLPAITTERNDMNNGNPHREMPGSGVMFWEDESQRRSDKAPDYKGFIILKHDYAAGEKLKLAAWAKTTSRNTTLLSLKEDDFLKMKQIEENAPREVTSRTNTTGPRRRNNDEDIPF